MNRPFDRATTEPGGMECMECGVIFVGAEHHYRCALCDAKHGLLDALLTADDVWADYGSGFRIHFSFHGAQKMEIVAKINTVRALLKEPTP
jgi:hypothetical protein